MKLVSLKQPKKIRAQAIVEFMLALPVLLMLLYGIVEVGRLIFIFSSVANASRQAARYGSASGEVDNVAFYQDCEGIRAVANQSAFLIEFDEVNVTYDRGINPDGTSIPIEGIDPDPSEDSCPIEDYTVRNGDRIIVQVSTTYEPILGIVPIDPLEIVSASARSFLIAIPIVGNSLPTGFGAETSTPSPIPGFVTATINPTATFIPTSVNMPKVTAVKTKPPTATLAPTNTALPTYTPSATATAISCSGLTGVSHGPLVIKDNVMEMKINNQTGHNLITAQIYLEWNHDTGHLDNDRSLRLRQIVLDKQVWNGDLQAPSAYIPAYYPRIPQGESTIQFIFHQTYDLADGTERIIVNIGNPGCINYPVDSDH
jgi:hypothetical protein